MGGVNIRKVMFDILMEAFVVVIHDRVYIVIVAREGNYFCFSRRSGSCKKDLLV